MWSPLLAAPDHGGAAGRAAGNGRTKHVRAPNQRNNGARRTKNRDSHKKACVYVARKRAVIMHRMLITGEAFRWPQIQAAV